jgi:MFS family permease
MFMSKATGRHLPAVCLATLAWSFSFGLGTQVITLWLKAENASLSVGPLTVRGDAFIGLNHSIYYVGIALASIAVPWMIRRLGSSCAGLGMILSGLSLILFPYGAGPVSWFALRLASGMAGALSLVPLETLVGEAAAPEQRTRQFSFYAVALTLGGAVGIWAGLHYYQPGGTMTFFGGGILPIGAGFVLLRLLPKVEAEGTFTRRPSERQDSGRHVLCFGTAWFQGFLEGGMLAFLSLYLISLGMSADLAGGLMSVTLVGVILFQVPVAWLADRFGRLLVLLACYSVVGCGLVLVPLCQASVWLGLCLFFLGACSGALYPLALALLGERTPREGLARAYSIFMAMECVGSQFGATAMGQARDWWGEGSMFATGLAALVLVLASWLVVQWWQFLQQAPAKGKAQDVQPAQRITC